jgi:hypothetical protein
MKGSHPSADYRLHFTGLQFFEALPPHMAVRLRLTVESQTN